MNLDRGYFAPRSTQVSIPLGSANEYQLRLGRQRQVWLIPLADETHGVQVTVKLCYPLTVRVTLQRLRDASCGGAIQIDYLYLYPYTTHTNASFVRVVCTDLKGAEFIGIANISTDTLRCASGCVRVPDLQLGGCRFESRPWLLRTKVYSAFHPSGSVNEYQL